MNHRNFAIEARQSKREQSFPNDIGRQYLAHLRHGREDKAIELLERKLADSEDNIPMRLSLAIAYLRLAEKENCLAGFNQDRCIYPIRGKGIHSEIKGSHQALEQLERVLAASKPEQPSHKTALWLAQVAESTLPGAQATLKKHQLALPVSTSVEPFENLVDKWGMAKLTEAGGVIADDFNNDGWPDIIWSSRNPEDSLRFYLNNEGRGFKPSNDSGLEGVWGGLNLVQADYDGDGWLDLLVLRGAFHRGDQPAPPLSLYRNLEGRFKDVTEESGIGYLDCPTQSAAWADYNGDGHLDLFIGDEREGSPGYLFRNLGEGRFRECTDEAGIDAKGQTKAVVWGDFNEDGFPDLFLANRKGENSFYWNKDGRFEKMGGLEEPVRSFGSLVCDSNNDGHLDLFVFRYSLQQSLGDLVDFIKGGDGSSQLVTYWGNGEGEFGTESVQGIKEPMWPLSGVSGDVNNDGYLDFYFGTGAPAFAYLVPNKLFLGQPKRKFDDASSSARVGNLQKGHGVALADLDKDGYLDIIAQFGGAYPADVAYDSIYLNRETGNSWLRIALKGEKSNRSGIGAKLSVAYEEEDEAKTIYSWMWPRSSFGGSPLNCHFGLGKAEGEVRVRVEWPSPGGVEIYSGLKINREHLLEEGSGVRDLDK